MDPRVLLGEAAAARRRTRRARQGFWLPLVLLGLVVLGSTPLYFAPSEAAVAGLPAGVVFRSSPSGPGLVGHGPLPQCVVTPPNIVYTPCGSTGHRPTVGYFPAGAFTASPSAIALFWIIALPAVYLAIAGWYLWRARRRGVATSPWAYVGLGLLLVAVLVVTSPEVGDFLHLPGAIRTISSTSDFTVRGLTPVLTIAAGLAALAVIERSRALGAYVVALVGLVMLADLYDIENLASRLGLGAHGPEVNVVVVGAFLVGGGVGFGLSRLRSST